MQLNAYLAANGLNFTQFARQLGTPHARTVERYAKGQSIPGKVMMRKIVAATSGAVQPNDFFAVTANDVTPTSRHDMTADSASAPEQCMLGGPDA